MSATGTPSLPCFRTPFISGKLSTLSKQVQDGAQGREVSFAPSAQRTAPKVAEAPGLQQVRSPDLHLPLSHRTSGCSVGGASSCIRRCSRGGLTTKIHALVD